MLNIMAMKDRDAQFIEPIGRVRVRNTICLYWWQMYLTLLFNLRYQGVCASEIEVGVITGLPSVYLYQYQRMPLVADERLSYLRSLSIEELTDIWKL